MKPRAFTLIELLVALAVVTILTVLLLTVVSQARQKARQTNCASNLRQISVALQMYVSDNDSLYPPDIDAVTDARGNANHSHIWLDFLKPYLGNDYFYCPSRSLPGVLAENERHHYLTGYAYNNRLTKVVTHNQASMTFGRTETTLAYPAMTVALLDARSGIISLSRPDTIENWKFANKAYDFDDRELIRAQPNGAERHSGGANYAFADGHVHWYKPTQLSVTRRSDGVRPGFGL